jgi:hypothetical protein
MTDAHSLPAKTIRIGRQPGKRHRADRGPRGLRHHAELRRHPAGSFEIIDLGSHGGTYVNGERITRKMLTEQDIISIGHATFRLSGGEPRQYADERPGSSPAMTNAHEVVAAYWARGRGPGLGWVRRAAGRRCDLPRPPDQGAGPRPEPLHPVQRGRLPLRLASHRAANRRRRPVRSQLDRVHRARRHAARRVLLRTRR